MSAILSWSALIFSGLGFSGVSGTRSFTNSS